MTTTTENTWPGPNAVAEEMKRFKSYPAFFAEALLDYEHSEEEMALISLWFRVLSRGEQTAAFYSLMLRFASSDTSINWILKELQKRETSLSPNLKEHETGPLLSEFSSPEKELLDNYFPCGRMAFSGKHAEQAKDKLSSNPEKFLKVGFLSSDLLSNDDLALHYIVQEFLRTEVHGGIFRVQNCEFPDMGLECKVYSLHDVPKNVRAQRIRNMKKLASRKDFICSIKQDRSTYMIYTTEHLGADDQQTAQHNQFVQKALSLVDRFRQQEKPTTGASKTTDRERVWDLEDAEADDPKTGLQPSPSIAIDCENKRREGRRLRQLKRRERKRNQ